MDVTLPTLLFWQNGNDFYGSHQGVRFYIQPKDNLFQVEVWRGLLNKQHSTIEERADFPLNEEGLNALKAWIASRSP